MAQWVRSSRLGKVAPLRSYVDMLQTAEELLEVYDAGNKVLARLAEAQAFIDNLTDLISGRFVIGTAYELLVSDLIGGLLTDSVFFLEHSNLGRVIERYGIAPYVDNAEAHFDFHEAEPVKTTQRTVTEEFLFQMEGQYVRLGSTVIDGLRNQQQFDSFRSWLDDIIAAFDDTGDFQRPIYGEGEELGAIVVTMEAVDPIVLFESFNRMKSVFSRELPPVPIDFSLTGKVLRQFAAAFPDTVDLEEGQNKRGARNLQNLREMAALEWFRPATTPESWNTPPDFTRMSTRDLIPILGDVLLTLGDLGRNFTVPRANILSLENLAESLFAHIEHLQDSIAASREFVQNIVNVLDTTAASRLFIDVQSGGVPGLMRALEEAEPTRKDIQRITNLGGNTNFQLNDTIPYDDAVAIASTNPAFQFRPVENLLISGLVIVFHPGPLASLLESIFKPTAEDIDEDENGTLVYETAGGQADSEEGAAPSNPSAGEPADGIGTNNTGGTAVPGTFDPGDPGDSATTNPPAGGGTVTSDGPNVGTTRSGTVHRDSLHASYGPANRSLYLQAAGASRSTVRKQLPAGDGYSTYEKIIPLGMKSLPTLTEESPSSTSRVFRSLEVADVLNGERVPVGSVSATYGARPEFSFPGVQWTPGGWDGTPVPELDGNGQGTAVEFEIHDGGTYLTSVSVLDPLFDALLGGYSGLLRPLYLPVDASWYVDFPVQWMTYTGAGGAKLRTSWIRLEIVSIEAAAGPDPRKYFVSPLAPMWPVILKQASYAGFFFVMDDPMYHARVEHQFAGNSEEIEGVELASPGVTFESVLAVRKQDNTINRDIDETVLMSLQAEYQGVLVDGDSTTYEGHSLALVLDSSDEFGVSTVRLSKTVQEKESIYPYGQTGFVIPEVQKETSLGTPLAVFPREMQQVLYDREGTLTVLTEDTLPLADRFQQNEASDRWLDLPHGFQLLTARVPRQFRVGLGELGVGAPFSLPIPSSKWVKVVVWDGAAWVSYELSAALNAGSMAGNVVEALSSLEVAHPGDPWALVVNYSSTTDSYTPEARLIPFIRHFETNFEMYGPLDRVVTPGTMPILARQGLCTTGLVGAFANVATIDSEHMDLEARLLKDSSRRPKSVQGRRVTLNFLPLVPWSSLPDGHYVLWETLSHVMALRIDGSVLFLRLLEYDLASEHLVVRLDVQCPDFPAGHRGKVVAVVVPQDKTLQAQLLLADNEVEAVPSYTVLADGTVTILSADTHPYVRAVDGFSASSGTIQIGHKEDENLLLVGNRDLPWAETRSIHVAGTPESSTWYLGAPPMGFLGIETKIEPASP